MFAPAHTSAAERRELPEPEKHVIRGRCRGMVREDWLSIAEMWYKNSADSERAAFRKTMRSISTEQPPRVFDSLSPATVASLLHTSATTRAPTQDATSHCLMAQVSPLHAKRLRRARLMLKLYFSRILRPEYHNQAFYYSHRRGVEGEQSVRSVFGGINSLSGTKFSLYRDEFQSKPDGGSVVGTRVVPLHILLERQMAEGRTKRVVSEETALQTAADFAGLSERQQSNAKARLRTSHWSPPEVRKARASPVWILDTKDSWNTTSREHYSGRQHPVNSGGDVEMDRSSPLDWVFATADQPPAVSRVTASANGCMPRTLGHPISRSPSPAF